MTYGAKEGGAGRNPRVCPQTPPQDPRSPLPDPEEWGLVLEWPLQPDLWRTRELKAGGSVEMGEVDWVG